MKTYVVSVVDNPEFDRTGFLALVEILRYAQIISVVDTDEMGNISNFELHPPSVIPKSSTKTWAKQVVGKMISCGFMAEVVEKA